MAFNFNWSPLIADTERARDMLTTALNKSPKPPIIVDDIIVNELNLGSKPPELEILEIGDLAEDRFRGIFKMRYDGDAYLTLKTRVQANPLNTYLSTKPGFASPETVAASSSLTIPLQITLSEIRLDGFVVLVFSKQKGITTVFRNDPLASLKVSSTFDSIPFVRDYLQRTIENQVKNLFMEDLPAIIHRLSLRVFNPEAQASDQQEPTRRESAIPARPGAFAGETQYMVDEDAWPLESSARHLLDPSGEIYATFSQKNILRLAALAESQRTLSLFTPSIRDTVYRAWASSADRGDTLSGTHTPAHRPTLSRIQSSLGSSTLRTGYSSASSQTSENESLASRPTLSSFGSSPTVYTLSTNRSRGHAQRKRKHRIVNLRKSKEAGTDEAGGVTLNDGESVSSGYTESAGASRSGPSVNGSSEAHAGHARDGELVTPPRSPQKRRVDFNSSHPTHGLPSSTHHHQPLTPSRRHFHPNALEDPDATPRASQVLPAPSKSDGKRPVARPHQIQTQHVSEGSLLDATVPQLQRQTSDLSRTLSDLKLASTGNLPHEGSTGGILEQAWINKMANEIARKVAEEKRKGSGMWRAPGFHGLPDEVDAPPAYAS